jgi:hypothetical protein
MLQNTVDGIIFSEIDCTAIGMMVGGPFGGIVGALIGTVVAIASAYMIWQLTSVYESTYANHNTGDKYIWTVMQNDYYYNWLDIAQDFTSNVCIYGYLSNGNTQTLLPTIPTLIAGSAYLSSQAHSASNNWVYAGY